MFRALLSIFLWPAWAIIFIIGAIIYSVAIIFIPSNKLHPLAQLLARLFMLFGGQWFQVKGQAPDPKNGPYLYLMNHESLFDDRELAVIAIVYSGTERPSSGDNLFIEVNVPEGFILRIEQQVPDISNEVLNFGGILNDS